MADNTAIEWADATVNAVNGCSVLSPGCTNCYAMKLAGTRLRNHPSRTGLTMQTKAGPVWTGKVSLHEPALLQPLRWKRPRRIFWNAHGDLFHAKVPWEWIAKVIAVCLLTPHHTHMILTKRGDRMRAWFETLESEGGAEDFCEIVELIAETVGREVDGGDWSLPIPNLWLGVSVEDQQRADERIPDLLATPAAVRFLSCEPLLGPLQLHEIKPVDPFDPFDPFNCLSGSEKIDWVIVGGESGPKARPMHPDWARGLRDQCAEAGVPFHFKQWGEWAPPEAFGAGEYRPVTDRYGNVRDRMRQYVMCEDRADRLDAYSFTRHATNLVFRVGKKRAGRLLDGREHSEFPA